MNADLGKKLDEHGSQLDSHTEELQAVSQKAGALNSSIEAYQNDSQRRMAAMKKGQEAAGAATKLAGDEARKAKSKGKDKDTNEVVEQVMAKVRPALRKFEKQLKEA